MTKKVLALFLVFFMLLPLSSCAPMLTDVTGIVPLTHSESESTEETEEISLPEGFSAGYARGDITPSLPVKLGSGQIATSIEDELYATCIALSDGETIALLFAMDMKDIPRTFFLSAATKIESLLGIPEENIIINGTHTHNCPHTTDNSNYNAAVFRQQAIKVMAQIAEEAISDLALAEVYTGTGNTTDFAFVRRYLMTDGSYKGIQSLNSSKNYSDHETEADPELRTIRFERADQKDIVMVNWQAHAAHAASAYPNAISADFITPLRDGVESLLDVHFAYFNGASGNINLTSYVGKQLYSNYIKVGNALVDVVEDALNSEEKAETGKIRTQAVLLPCNVQQDSEERREQAKKYAAANSVTKEVLLAEYGFQSQYEAIAINTRANMDPVTDVPLSVITFGEVAITANPFELFDTSAKEIRAASPYKMTFTLAYSNGSFGYMPPDEIFPHGEYEVYVSRFEAGTAEKCVAELVRMLNENNLSG